jgi:hypothetical protein
MHAPAVGDRGTRAPCATSNNFDLPHARRHGEILRFARVIKRFLAWKMVRGSAGRHETDRRLRSAASGEHCRSHAATNGETTELRKHHIVSPFKDERIGDQLRSALRFSSIASAASQRAPVSGLRHLR